MSTTRAFRRLAALVAAAGIAAVLAGCAQEPADVAGQETPIPTVTLVPTPSPTPTPTPTLTPSASPSAEPVDTCETVFTQTEYADLEADGLIFRGDAAQASADSNLFEDKGGISCLWVAPQSDVMAWYARWPSDEQSWNLLKADLLDKGYTEIADPFAGILQSPPDPNYTPAITYRDGVVHHVSTPQLFRSVLALS
jgi:hypothetical protein